MYYEVNDSLYYSVSFYAGLSDDFVITSRS